MNSDLQSVLNEVTYRPGWELKATRRGQLKDVDLIYWEFQGHDTNNPERIEIWKSRKWYISPYMTKEEMVKTAFLAVEVAEKHEMMEFFRYKGKILFDPHVDVDALLDADVPQSHRIDQ